MVAASALSMLLSSSAAFAQARLPTAEEPPLAAATRRPTAAQLEAWRQTILKTSPPTKGCYTAAYPDERWREVACKTPPHKLYPPKHGGMTQATIVGGAGTDFSAVVTGHVSWAEGSFSSLGSPPTVVTSECSVPCPPTANGTPVCPVNPSCAAANAVPNNYSVQLNTEFFQTTTCQNSLNPNPPGTPNNGGCQGWEQFVYEGSSGGFIQYWLTNYGPPAATCPAPISASCQNGAQNGPQNDGWCPVAIYGGTDCVVNASGLVPAPSAQATLLGGLKVRGAVAGVNGMANDSIVVTVGNSVNNASGNNYFQDLGSQWQEAEFNVFGNGGGDQAVFGAGTTVYVRTELDSGTTSGPTCDSRSFTAESNNLTLVNTPPVATKGAAPALVFSESNPAVAGAPATCADALSLGDTHLTTFDGLQYDFQASGDFVLAQAGPDFIVHTRQALAVTDPRWIKNATINKAVATQMGKTRVAIYIWPARLVIDGQPYNLADGKSLLLASGVQVSLKSDAYLITSPNGNSVQATVNNNNINSWINVTVGLSHAPQARVRGLLGNPDGNASELATASGTVLKAPLSFTDLYHTYADSWRVQPHEALLVEDLTIKPSIPDKPIYAVDLDPEESARVREICVAAGVTAPALLEACTLDTAVLGDEAPVRVFVNAKIPRAVLPRPTFERAGFGAN
jgi:hypothetical protein